MNDLSLPIDNDPNWHKRPRFWTRARVIEVLTLIEQGQSDRQIADRFKSTARAIKLVRKRHGIPAGRNSTLTARSIQRIVGMGDSKTVRRWIDNGWLSGSKTDVGAGRNYRWRITHAQLFTFLEDPAHWHRWDPERITDLGLRQWAIEMRAGVRFLNLTEASRIAFVEPKTIWAWIDKGWLSEIRNGNHVVREDELRALVERRLAA